VIEQISAIIDDKVAGIWRYFCM